MPPANIPLLVVFLLFAVCHCQELTNFTYAKHGDDWDTSFCRAGSYFLTAGAHQSPIELKRTARNINSYLFTDFREAETDVKFYNTTIYLNSSSLGSVYILNMYGKALAMNALEVRIRCKAEHVVSDDGVDAVRHDLELQVRLG